MRAGQGEWCSFREQAPMRQHILSVSGEGTSSSRSIRKTRRHAAALALATAAAAGWAYMTPNVTRAATKNWTAAGSGNWSGTTNWNPSGVPAVTGDTVNITDNAANTKTVTFDGSATTTSVAALTV